MSGRALIVVITGAIFAAGTVYIWVARKAERASRPRVSAYAIAESRNVSETAAAMAIGSIRANGRGHGGLFETPLSLFGGTAFIRATDLLVQGKRLIRIEAVGEVENHFDTTLAYMTADSARPPRLP
jgi:hypothetical protein